MYRYHNENDRRYSSSSTAARAARFLPTQNQYSTNISSDHAVTAEMLGYRAQTSRGCRVQALLKLNYSENATKFIWDSNSDSCQHSYLSPYFHIIISFYYVALPISTQQAVLT
ncbi:hypothetical protein PUN28_003760 [Cardiocondyla obscurior]|uniref:Uncharacterized protein n=1 Tax=Cardiocondyla obscurior TaxID=286306 RepID=A0AAW2GM75_9HYME